MYRRALLSVCILFILLLGACGTPPTEDAYQHTDVQVGDAALRQKILLLHKAIEEDPQPKKSGGDLGWTTWEGSYPYLQLGKIYLDLKDPFSASYYCSRSKAEGVSPPEEVEACLECVSDMLRQYRSVASAEFPSFPWPPPEASAKTVVSSSFFVDSDTRTLLRDVASRLEKALPYAGYVEFSYYQIPGGFALVTRIEQFDDNGSSKAPPDRWVLDMPPAKIFSLGDYLKALFHAEKGYYRVISFLITSVPFSQAQRKIKREDAMAWLSRGANMLPEEIGAQEYSTSHYCTALIYEFQQETRDHKAEFKSPGRLTGDVHLQKSLLSEALEKFSLNAAP